MGKITCVLGSISVAIFLALSFNGCNNPNQLVIIQAPTSMYEDYPKSGPPTAKVIAILNKGETAEVIHVRWAKDCEYLKVRVKDGRTGYIGWDGNYKIVPKPTDG